MQKRKVSVHVRPKYEQIQSQSPLKALGYNAVNRTVHHFHQLAKWLSAHSNLDPLCFEGSVACFFFKIIVNVTEKKRGKERMDRYL